MEKTKAEVSSSDESICGDIYIGGVKRRGNSQAGTKRHPNIQFHLFSGDGYDVTEWLDRGMIDFGTLIELVDLSGDTCLCFSPTGAKAGILDVPRLEEVSSVYQRGGSVSGLSEKSPSVALYME